MRRKAEGLLKGKARIGVIFVLFALLVTAIILPLTIRTALADTSGDYEYAVNADGATATITGYTGPGGDITIPDTVTDGTNTYTVTAIGENTFAGEAAIASVMISNEVTSIGASAFSGCTLLRSAYFLGDAPSADVSSFNSCATGFTVYYKSTSTGFTDTWYGYTTRVFNPDVTYAVSFDLNGVTGTAPDMQTVFEGIKAVYPVEPTFDGKIFGGWFIESTCETEWDFDTAVTDDLTLFASWKDFNGSGTEDDPYQVSTPEQLNAVRDYPDACFIMMNDIDMTEATSEGGVYWNDGEGWEPIGDYTTPFTGVFDGCGYKIINLYINNPSSSYIGLFGGNVGSITRLGMINCQITADDEYEEIYVGSIAGINNGGEISECYCTGRITAYCYHAEVGGIAGSLGRVAKCYNTSAISANGYYANVGGIIGSYGIINECYNLGSITISGQFVGAISGRGGTLTNCYYTNINVQSIGSYPSWGAQNNVIRKTSAEMTVQSEFIGFDFENTWVMSNDDRYPCPILKTINFPAQEENTTDFAGGIGNIFSPYKISSAEQLNNVRSYLGSHFILVNNIDMTEVTSEGGEYYNDGGGWNSIGGTGQNAFCGSFDGAGYVISGLSSTGAGLFVQNDGLIQNLGMENVSIVSSDSAAAVAAKNNGVIINCYSTGEIYSEDHTGGIAAVSGGTISYCYNSANVTSKSSFQTAGGIVGYLGDNGTVSCCYNTGNIKLLNLPGASGTGSAGGIVGEGLYSDATLVENCFNTGAVYVQDSGDYAGGIAGSYIDDISHCYNIGQIFGSDNNAAIISKMNSDTVIDTCFLDNGEEDLTGAYRSSDDTELSNKRTLEEMILQATFGGFNFDTIWEIPESGCYPYPMLKNISVEPFQSETEMFAGGLGIIGNPYIIATPEHLNNMRYYDYKYFILSNDIDMTEATDVGGAYWNGGAGWEPIGFTNTLHIHFEGNGHTIIGLTINRPEQSFVGLFGTIASASIKNLNLDCVNITGASNCGGIAGMCGGEITNCTVTGNVSGMAVSSDGVGGIVGYMKGDISYCTNMVEVSSSSYMGGIAGIVKGDVGYCGNHGELMGLGPHPIGGIVGVTWGLIHDCYNTADLHQTHPEEDSGGIAGWHYSIDNTYVNCYNIGHATYGITACYWLNTTGWSNCYYIEAMADEWENYGYAVTTADLEDVLTYEGFDFTSAWTMDGEPSYPYAELQGVLQPPVQVVTGIEVLPETLDINVGEVYTSLEINVLPVDAFNKEVFCSSSNSDVAEIDANGDITGVSAGSAIITITSEDGGFTDICIVTVIQPVSSASLSSNAETIVVGDTLTLTATVLPSDATYPAVTWSSSNTHVATADQTGNVTAIAPGSATITATADGVSDTCTITVNQPVSSVSLSSNEQTMTIGDFITLSATVSPSDATYPTVTWSSDNTAVATVDQTGKVTAIAPGSATITATADGISDTCEVTVEKIPVSSVSLNSNTETMFAGNSLVLIATVLPSDATYSTVTWSSSNTNVATVDQTGKVTAVASGSVTITATADGISDTCSVTVQAATFNITATPNNTSYGSVAGGNTYSAGASVTLTATPYAGCRFVCWKNGTTPVSTNATYSFTANANVNLTAEFTPIGTPTVMAASAGYDRNQLSWNTVEGAAGYEVWRSTSSGGVYSKVGAVSGTAYIDAGLAINTTYYYKVNAYCTASTATTSGSQSVYASATPVPSAPGAVYASGTSYNSVKVSWDAVPGATGYYIYRATSASGVYKYLKSTTALSYSNTSLYTGTTYYYQIRPYRTVGRTKVFGDYSAATSVTPMLSPVATATATSTYPTKIKLTWSAVSGRTKYEVWYSTSQNGTYTLLGTTTRTYYNVSSLRPFQPYYYYVKVYRTVSRQKVYAAANSPIATATPVLASVTNVKTAKYSVTGNKLTWSSVSGASGYEVLRWDEAQGNYVSLGTTTRKYYYDKNLIPNRSYTYQVRAYCKVGTDKVYSTACAPVSATPVFGSVTNPKAVRSNATKIKLTWSAVSGRSGYEIYRATSADGEYEMIGSTMRTSYYSSGLATGTPYYYKIRAYVVVKGVRQYSDYSAVVTATP